MAQPQQPLQMTAQNPVNAQVNPYDAVKQKGIENAINRCNKVYDELLSAISLFKEEIPNRPKRQIGLALSMVGGYYFSDIVKTIEDKWFHKNAMSDDEKEAVISKKLENLNNQMELQKFINHLQMSKMHEIDAWPNKMSASLKDIITKYPEMSMMASYIVTKIFEKASQINHLYVSMRQDQPDLVSIGEILHNG